jgi:hypothetical protein
LGQLIGKNSTQLKTRYWQLLDQAEGVLYGHPSKLKEHLEYAVKFMETPPDLIDSNPTEEQLNVLVEKIRSSNSSGSSSSSSSGSSSGTNAKNAMELE